MTISWIVLLTIMQHVCRIVVITLTEEIEMSAYEMGWTAAERGQSLKDNPFVRGSGEEISWRWGYQAFCASVWPANQTLTGITG